LYESLLVAWRDNHTPLVCEVPAACQNAHATSNGSHRSSPRQKNTSGVMSTISIFPRH
jgi:hypothetical protein